MICLFNEQKFEIVSNYVKQFLKFLYIVEIFNGLRMGVLFYNEYYLRDQLHSKINMFYNRKLMDSEALLIMVFYVYKYLDKCSTIQILQQNADNLFGCFGCDDVFSRVFVCYGKGGLQTNKWGLFISIWGRLNPKVFGVWTVHKIE
eukprot:TRINITY_DN7599_c0_g1_i1.p5 TRINITY_DN7599_c0_g1~~TRINITY_DN7599_c0_g1_i1.p5  ORF type:complete len:146 (+),score=5.69 TRINITY_DN7599_c0_g1_i1:207-644(+)